MSKKNLARERRNSKFCFTLLLPQTREQDDHAKETISKSSNIANMRTSNDSHSLSKKYRRVTFATTEDGKIKATSCKSSYRRSNMSDHVLWWTKNQRTANRKDAFMEAVAARGSFAKDGEFIRSAYSKTLAQVYEAKLKGKKIPYTVQAEFYFEVSLRHTVRGLEKLIYDGIKSDRKERREMDIEGVLHIQQRCLKEGRNETLRTNMIRLASESITKEAKCIARMYGDADQFASQFQATGKPISAPPMAIMSELPMPLICLTPAA
jgi:hypothetical protein